MSTEWIQSFTGRKLFPLNLKPEDICIEDIAHALSMQCRFLGHCHHFWSTAQHSVLVSMNCDYALWGLLHDASEAYLCDVSGPLKQHEAFKMYRHFEDEAMKAICVRFGLSIEMPRSVKKADLVLLATEKRDLMADSHPWTLTERPLEQKLWPVNSAHAERMFLDRFHELYQGEA